MRKVRLEVTRKNAATRKGRRGQKEKVGAYYGALIPSCHLFQTHYSLLLLDPIACKLGSPKIASQSWLLSHPRFTDGRLNKGGNAIRLLLLRALLRISREKGRNRLQHLF